MDLRIAPTERVIVREGDNRVAFLNNYFGISVYFQVGSLDRYVANWWGISRGVPAQSQKNFTGWSCADSGW